jgi:lysophospholipase L1-like esterase
MGKTYTGDSFKTTEGIDLVFETLKKGGYTGTAQDLQNQIVASVTGVKGETLTPSSAAIGGTGVASFIVIEAGTYTNNGGFVLPANSIGVIARNASDVLSFSSTAFDLSPYIKIPTYNFGSELTNAGSTNADTTTYIFATAQKKARVKSVSFYVLASGTLSIKRFTKSTDDLSLIYGGEVTVAHVAGLNTISPPDLFLQAGDYIGVHTTSKIKFISSGTNYSQTYYITPFEDIQTSKNFSNLNLLPSANEIQINFKFEEYEILEDLRTITNDNSLVLTDVVSRVSVLESDLEGVEQNYSFGSSVIEDATTVALKSTTYIFSKNVELSTLKVVNFYAATSGSFKLKVINKVGNLFTFVKEITIPATVGVNNYTLPTPLNITEGNSLAIYTTNVNFKYRSQSLAHETWYFVSGDLLTSTNNPTFDSGNEIKISFELSNVSKVIDNINDRLDVIEPKILALENPTYLTVPKVFGDTTISQGASNSTTNLTFIFDEENTGFTLNSVSFYARKTGSIKLKIITKSGSTYTFKSEISIPTTLGVNNYTLPSAILIGENEKISIYEPGGVTTYDLVSTEYATFQYFIGDLTTSTSNTDASAGEQVNITFNLTGPGSSPTDRLDILEPIVSNLQSKIVYENLGNNLINESFTLSVLPTTLENVGSAWTFANGRTSAGGNGLANGLQAKLSINSNSKTTRADFFLSSADASIGIYNRPVTYAQSGTIVKIDIVTNSITLYENWNGSNTFPAVQQTKTISFTLAQGVPYRLSTKVLGKDLITSIINLKTGQSDGITITGGAVGFPLSGYAFGKAGVFKVAGTISLDYFQDIINGTDKPRCIFYGNSITEGYLLASADVYSYRALAALNNVGYISAQSGGKSIDVIERLNFEIDIFKPKYIHILIGTNDTVQATWISNMETIHALLLSKGIIPLIGCIPANTSNTSQVTTWNAELLTKPYRFVRYDLATTVNNEGQTIDSSLFNADGVHPNAAGGLAMYNRMVLDVPELFNN